MILDENNFTNSIFMLNVIVGLVNIDVELKDRTLNFSVSPVHAAIIMQFQQQGK